MAGEELLTRDQLIFRILEKESFGRQSNNVDDGSVPKLSDRFDIQRKNIKSKKQIAEFKFPINFQGETFYYQQYMKTIQARESTVAGIAGISSEAYGVGLQPIQMNGIFPPGATRNVILSTDFSFEAALTQYNPRDWADNLERFVKFYLDLNDPYSQIWTTEGYFEESSINLDGLISMLIGGGGEDERAAIGFEGRPNKAGYEFVVVDEYAKTIQTIQPKEVQIFTQSGTPLTYGWRLNATVIEDKLDANFKPIPDDILQLAASFRLPAISELPIVGPLSTTVNKLIAISNATNNMMTTILTYKTFPNTVIQSYNSLLTSNAHVLHKIERIAGI
ncbi:hypothetical protein KAR91_17720 [Candidatus Pacearchaeota archaeon]|nr:hypothetical protein [Candidatus Pacearchaeota archaeon]